ncbi:MAG: hypothetical protein B7X41_07765 [Microbacterium sp. 14-71-5]|nr:MAG: hypothetical protein B7X41_07765 [Microbacterium sp. 14-71-5]
MTSLPTGLPDLRGLALLVAVADTGGIGAAARATGISQPSASEGVRALERRLGLALVRRGRSGSGLTDEGRLVVELARRVLTATTDLTDAARALRREQDSHLTVCASLTVAEHLVPQWLVRMSREAPEISIAVRMANSADVAEQVRSGAVALGFVEGASAPRGLRSTTICTDELMLLVRAAHPWAGRSASLRPRDLAGVPLALREPGSGTRDVLERWLAREGVTPTTAVEVASTTALVAAALSGVAPTVISGLAVQAELAQGRLVPVPLATGEQSRRSDGGPLRRRIRAVWQGPGAPGAAAARLLEVILDR